MSISLTWSTRCKWGAALSAIDGLWFVLAARMRRLLFAPDSTCTGAGVEENHDTAVVFMFPGQGAQHVGMALEVYRDEPVFRREIDLCAKLLAPQIGRNLCELLYPEPDARKQASNDLNQTQFTQPALFAVEYALARLWQSWGVHPRAMVGHSVGEYVCACLAGVFTLEGALALVSERGRLIPGVAFGRHAGSEASGTGAEIASR